MATVRYTTINGEIIAEKRNGVRRTYVPDPLGSTVALLDNTQTITDTFDYWPYGEERQTAARSTERFRYVGTLGCVTDVTNSRIYMRARIQRPNQGRWLTVDLLWPWVGADSFFSGPW